MSDDGPWGLRVSPVMTLSVARYARPIGDDEIRGILHAIRKVRRIRSPHPFYRRRSRRMAGK